jgi:glycosyltransferase involved in cell wall biosynthesis
MGQPHLPLITTIIPTFRRPDRLKKAIQSILNQTYPHFQVCIYDNASGDETAVVVSEFAKVDDRIKYHCHQSNIGAAENFQYGLSHVETPFFSFLSDDDYLLPEFYQTALNGFKNYPDAAFSAGTVIDVNEEGEILDVILSKWPEKEYYSPPEGLLEMIGKHSNWIGALFRKESIEKIGPIDLALKAIDIDYMLRIAGHLPFVISKNPCAVFVQHRLSYSRTHGLKLIWPGWKIIMSKVKEDPRLSLETKMLAEQKLQIELENLLFLNALKCLKNKEFDEAALIAGVFIQLGNKKWKKHLLVSSISICTAFPFFHTLYMMLFTLRRFWSRRIRMAHMQSEYGRWVVESLSSKDSKISPTSDTLTV